MQRLTDAGSTNHLNIHRISLPEKTVALLVVNQWCALMTFPQLQRARPTCQWLVMSPSPPSRPLWMCRLRHLGRQVLAGRDRFSNVCALLMKADVRSVRSHCTLTHIHTCTIANQCLGSLHMALLSVVRYQPKTERPKYLVWSVFKHLKSEVLLLQPLWVKLMAGVGYIL